MVAAGSLHANGERTDAEAVHGTVTERGGPADAERDLSPQTFDSVNAVADHAAG